uniref:HSA domain-containing protein n=1 Tax=Aegilops tauschii TaxID=37682 RepID=M8C2F0_AEGTA
MGGMIEYGVSVSTKSSPRSVAIEKAQEELRQEYDVREERRRELEFLEKGGNPLDFKVDRVESISVQSTSLTAEQNVISEAKGSFTFAASPRGDSVESSGKPGSSLCRETNTADNLMLFGGNNNGVVKEKVVKRGSRRANVAQPRQSAEGHNNVKRADDSGLSRLGVKSQAYVRRNRSKQSRESANVTSVTSPVIPATASEPKDARGVVKEKRADDLGVSYGSNLNQAGPKCDNGPNKASDKHVTIELNGIQAVRKGHRIVKIEPVEYDEMVPNYVNRNQQPDERGKIAEEGASIEPPDATSKAVLRSSYSSACTHDKTETCAAAEKVGNNHLDEGMAQVHVGELDNSSMIPVSAVQAATLHKNVTDPCCEDIASTIDNGADDNNPVPMNIDGKSHEDPDISGISSKAGGQLERSSRPTSVTGNSSPVPPEVSTRARVKVEMETFDDAMVVQKDTSCSYPGQIVNNNGGPGLERIDSCHGDSNSAHPIVIGSATLVDSTPSLKTDGSKAESEIQKNGESVNKMTDKEHEDSILREARLIEVSLKRACERSPCNISLERRRKGHWDFVLEEMAWMANDFMQERLWRITAASQVCHWIASDGLAKFDQASILRKQKTVSRILAKGVMSFWRSAEAVLTTVETSKVMQKNNSNMLGETKPTGTKAEKQQGNESLEAEQSIHPLRSHIQDYAVRFLEYSSQASDSAVLTEAPPTPDRPNDFGILKVSDQLSQGSLFYTVPPGAMLAYRESMESLFMYHKKIGNTGLDYEASACDSAAGWAQDNVYEDEGEASTYLSRKGHKKKHSMQQRINGSRPYETDVSYDPRLESKAGNRQFVSNGKRPSSFVGIPTKRIRTAARQRVVSPFPASAGGTPQVTSKTDVSSGDTNSYQDDQSPLHGGSSAWKNMEYESTGDFDRHDGSEAWTKANKKKKQKNPGYKTAQNTANSRAAAVKGRIYDQRSQVNQYEQKDYLKKRPETQQFYSNGTIVANGGQHASKKLKTMKQGIYIKQEPSQVPSQMSNMAPANKIIKIITNKDRGRKVKALKMSSGGGWSNFEDQFVALVVLVHDLGQNWELVSDAINNIVQFKSIHRQPKECKERHRVLVDKSSGDGADSAEDSGSTYIEYTDMLLNLQCSLFDTYLFNLWAMGSARQLFQRLQGPFEEENLKSHFEKIMLLMPKVLSRRRQVNSRELKPIVLPHSSHVVALTQACPNNLSGGILMPLDLCDVNLSLDAVTPGSGNQISHANGMTLSNQHGSAGPTTTPPTPNPNSRLPGSPGMVLGSNFSPPSTLSAPSRDPQKYGVPRPASIQGDEQQKIQYNQMLSGRNLQQPGAVPATSPGARMMPGAHGVGMMTGVNRGLFTSHATLTLDGNNKSADGILPFFQPGQQHMARPEHHMQVSQGNSQAAHFSSMNPSFSKAAAPSPLQQTQRPHQMSQPLNMLGNPHLSQTQGTSHPSPQQQPYSTMPMQLAKERQFQHRLVSQQHNSLPVAGVVPGVQNGPQIQQQNHASPVTSTPSSQPLHQKQQSAQSPTDSSALANRPANATEPKQKKQQGQQQPRQNQQQRNQASQQAKLMKSLGRGNSTVTPQTPAADATPPSAVPTASKKQVPDRNLMQHGQGSSAGNKASTAVTPQPGNQHKLYASVQQPPNIGNQGLVQGPPSHTVFGAQPPPLHSRYPVTTQQRPMNPAQNNIQRMMMQQSLQMKPDSRMDAQMDQVQHSQAIPATPTSHSSEAGSPGLSAHDPAAVTSTSKPLNSPKDNFAGNETSVPPSSSQGMLQRQISGGTSSSQGMLQRQISGGTSSSQGMLQRQISGGSSSSQGMLQRQISGGLLPVHGQEVGGSWHHQQLSRPHHQQLQQRPVGPGSMYAPPNPGSGAAGSMYAPPNPGPG